MVEDEFNRSVVRPHRKLEKNIDGQQIYALNFKNSEFDDIIFSYDRVEFIEDSENDKLITRFNYIVHDHKREYDKVKFEKELGDFLIELVVQGALENNLIFTGDGDEQQDRTDDNSSFNN